MELNETSNILCSGCIIEGNQQLECAPLACDDSRTLVVDDEAAIVSLYRRIITTVIPDMNVDTASNGKEAVDSFIEKHQSVLLMDIHMPVMDGQMAFREIEKVCRERNWIMPSVVFCTGYAPPSLVKEVVSNDSRHRLLLKPPSFDEIIGAVSQSRRKQVA